MVLSVVRKSLNYCLVLLLPVTFSVAGADQDVEKTIFLVYETGHVVAAMRKPASSSILS